MGVLNGLFNVECEIKQNELDNRIEYIRSLDRKLCLFEPATQGSHTSYRHTPTPTSDDKTFK